MSPNTLKQALLAAALVGMTYDPGNERVVIAEKRKDDSGEIVSGGGEDEIAGVIRHEYGHGADQKLGYASNHADFIAMHESDVKDLLTSTGSAIEPNGHHFSGDAAQLNYYMQPAGGTISAAGRSEAFAEAFAALYGGGCSGELFAKWFPRTIRSVSDKVKQRTGAKAMRPSDDEPEVQAWGIGDGMVAERLVGENGIIGDVVRTGDTSGVKAVKYSEDQPIEETEE
jgi:hypothetical protein